MSRIPAGFYSQATAKSDRSKIFTRNENSKELILEKPLGRPGFLTKFLARIHSASDLGHVSLVKHARHYVEKYEKQEKRIAAYNSEILSRLKQGLKSEYSWNAAHEGLWRAGISVHHNDRNIPLTYRKVEKAAKEADRAQKLYRCQNESKTRSYLQGEFDSQKSGPPFAKMPEGSQRFLERIFRELCDKKYDEWFGSSTSLTTQEHVEAQVLRHYEQLKARAGASNELDKTLRELADAKEPDVDKLMKLALDAVAPAPAQERAL